MFDIMGIFKETLNNKKYKENMKLFKPKASVSWKNLRTLRNPSKTKLFQRNKPNYISCWNPYFSTYLRITLTKYKQMKTESQATPVCWTADVVVEVWPSGFVATPSHQLK